jgi:hypothetical protein
VSLATVFAACKLARLLHAGRGGGDSGSTSGSILTTAVADSCWPLCCRETVLEAVLSSDAEAALALQHYENVLSGTLVSC